LWKKSKSNSDKICTIQKKSKLNSEKIEKIWEKHKLNSGMIWKIWENVSRIVKRYETYGRKAS